MCATIINMFNYNFELVTNVYINALKYCVNLYVSQIQNGEVKSILYNSIAFNSIQKNYDTYKKKLLIIVLFTIKYEHIFNNKQIIIIHTNHKLLIEFLNVVEYKNIYAR